MFKKLLRFQIRNFSKTIKKNPVKNILNDTKYLLSLKNIEYQETLTIILQGYYQKSEKEQILKKIQEYSKLSESETLRLFDSINNIYTFLEKSNYGFLSGDLQPQFLTYLKRLLEKDKYDLSEIAFKLFQSLNDEEMKLPEGGIKYPEIESQSSLFERQLILENISYESSLKKILEVNQEVNSSSRGIKSSISSKLIERNFDDLNKLIMKEMENANNIDKLNSKNYCYKFFSVLSSETWTMITLVSIYEIMSKNIVGSSKKNDNFINNYINEEEGVFIFIQDILKTICKNLNKELRFEIDYKEYKKNNSSGNFIMNRKAYIEFRNKKRIFYGMNDPFQIIPESSQIEIATILIFFLRISYKNIENDNLILEFKNFSSHDKSRNYFKINKHYIDKFHSYLSQSKNEFLQLEQAFPLIYTPAKWESFELGGYYLKPSIFMKCNDNIYQKRALIHSDLSRVYSIIDYISDQPWKIDKFVLSVSEKIWEKGGGLGSIPYRYDKDLENKSKTSSYNFHIGETYGKKSTQFNKDLQGEYDNNSSRSFFLLRMNVAKAFQNIGKIYFPHNLDFRGRIYPIPPHLNHMGDDLSRSLLVFANSKKLGKDGLKWLKIHLANKMGRDKLPLYEREAFIDDNLSMLEKWNKDPIKNDDWLELDDCWQSLGAMNELFKAINSNNPTEFLSCLPIHQDGTCNGLQHYAAIGRDQEGAKEVNLIKMDKPGDVYTKVCKMVIENIEEEIKIGILENDKIQETARKLLPILKRKIVKQTVMTTVYGVTFMGAKDQIKKQLREYYNYTDDEDLKNASVYLARHVLKAVSDLFSNAHKIKHFLTSCVDILNSNNQAMSWFTPLGLPICQPYYKDASITTNMNILMNFSLKNQESIKRDVIKPKQKSAFPPNYIHSLDSTHLMMTAERMRENGLNFASVHDSFWTHACDVDKMSGYLREEFIKLYNMDLLGDLKYELEMRFPEETFPDIPTKGDLDLNSVLQSEYFFS